MGPQPAIDIAPEILHALAAGATVLTPNQRAARALRLGFDRHFRTAGHTLWTPPPIFALDTWLVALHNRMIQNGAGSRLLLNRIQERALWRSVIAADRDILGLRSAESLADLAAEAWRVLCLHNGRNRLREFHVSTDTRAFASWAARFIRACSAENFLAPAELPAMLEAALSDVSVPIPDAGILLVDFTYLPPAHTRLIDSMERAGFAVRTFATAVAAPATSLLAASDAASEIGAAARWVLGHIQRNPSASIALVVPDLGARRGPIQRVLSEVLGPPSADPPPFEFSLGRPLAETAPVAVALDLLRWCMGPLPLQTISSLLLSPLFGAAATQREALAAAEFDAFGLRRQDISLRPELSLDAFFRLAQSHETHPRLDSLLHRVESTLRVARSERLQTASPPSDGPRQSHAGWADAFRNLLEATGWTAAAQVSSESFQAQRRWESALDELSTLDFDGTESDAAGALSALTRIAQDSIFAPESRDAPLQIVGPLELGGVPFDALWFLGADDQTWPISSASSALLPWHIQRELRVPAAAPLEADGNAGALTALIAHAAPEVVFSFARHAEEGEARPSPLLRALTFTPFAETAPPARLPQPLACIIDDEPIPALEEGRARGGAAILSLQAACPFRAFAELRLFSAEPESSDAGLDPRDRGELVHTVMQLFWNAMETQSNLRSASPAEREALLEDCIASALAHEAGKAGSAWDRAYLDVQYDRLRSLLLPWLRMELDRPPFAVESREHLRRDIPFGPLRIDLRADRVDRTAAGALILDYKTGVADTSAWRGDRPDAPQLPLYAVLAETADHRPETIAGIAFAQLRAGDALALKGFADGIAALSQPARMPFATMAEQLEDWRRVLGDLAASYAGGDVRVDPKAYPKTCSYCAQRTFCRLDPSALSATEGEQDEAFNTAVAERIDG